jgi:uncharacterized protein (DUF608 family)
MKGHVGGGPVSDSLWVSVGRSNLCRSLWISDEASASAASSYVSKTQTHQIVIFVQERLPEMPACQAYSAWLVVHQLESLILAQNERWRHA